MKTTLFSFKTLLLLLTLLVILLSVANLMLGSADLNYSNILKFIIGHWEDERYRVILIDYRLPQVFTAIATGIALSIAGLMLQALFKNPLAGPSVLGISAGASLGVAIIILAGSALGINLMEQTMGFSGLTLILAAFAGALTILFVIIFISNRIAHVVTILILGIMIGYLVSALVGILQYFSGNEALQSFVIWGLGSFAKNSLLRSVTMLLTVLFLSFLLFFFGKTLNVMILGDQYAKSMGVNVNKIQKQILLLSGLLIALGTAFTGPIAFIGLAVPHIARAWLHSADHKKLIPLTLLIGANFALLCNVLARLPGTDTTLPINAATSLLGAPIVIWVIVKRSKIKAGSL